jgi:glycerophosphoryl diester phosphodiesterase
LPTDLRLVQLLGGGNGACALGDIASYADGIGPAKTLIVPHDDTGRSMAPTSLVDDAHAAGLFVHPWTFRRENAFLPLELWQGDESAPGDLAAELTAFFDLGVDGVFTDNPDIALAVRSDWARARA